VGIGLLVRGFLSAVLLSACALCQLPSSQCDVATALAECTFTTAPSLPLNRESESVAAVSMSATSAGDPASDAVNAFISNPRQPRREGFHWGRALFESFTFLSIEQAYVVHDDFRYVIRENDIPFNHYWRDYKESLNTWIHAGWDDGDPSLYSYVGHPIQGALAEYIQIQNDPQGRDLEFSNTKAYWWSRFKAFLWNSAYSTQWNIGPISELTVEKYGTQARTPWNHNGTWPCYRDCVSGVGQVDLVVTPIAGTAWLLGEDLLDKEVVRRLEAATQNRFLIDLTRCTLNPIRGGANILHGKRPWYRASRDASGVHFSPHPPSRMVPPGRSPTPARATEQ
jgi:hypothetical protein